MDIPKTERRGRRYILFGLAVLSTIFLIVFLFTGQSANELSYNEFKKLLYEGRLSKLLIAEDTVTGTLQAKDIASLMPPDRVKQLRCDVAKNCPFWVTRLTDPMLVPEMELTGVEFIGVRKSGAWSNIVWWTLPLLLLFWWPSMVSRSSGLSSSGLLGIGKSRARVYAQVATGVSFADVAGIDEAKEELMEVVDFLRNPDRYSRLGGRIPKGVLIVGAPGTGKTLLAKAVAGEADVPFISISGSEFVEMFVGVGAARVRDLFAQAVQKAPCIVFIDEIDALGRARGITGLEGGSSEQEQTLNQLLVEMEGFNTNSGVIILAATNRPEILDPALLRPGRFDRHIALDRPDLGGRRQILLVHLAHIKCTSDIDLDGLAARTAGFAGADLANLVNEAALLAARNGKELVGSAEFDDAFERVVSGLEKKNRVMSENEKQTVAYHEAGHALIAENREHADRVAKISIIPRGIAALGYTRQLPTEDRYLLRKAELLDRLDVMLGGRVVEELAFDDVSTGAQNDLEQATEMARHMVLQYGMSEKVGLAYYDMPQKTGISAAPPRAYSERTARVIDAEVSALLTASRARVRATLESRRNLLDSLANTLLDKETLDRASLDSLFLAEARRPEMTVAAHH